MEKCDTPVSYKVSADGKYTVYMDKYIYSLVNNADAILDAPVFTDYYIDKNDGLSYLAGNNLVYYFIPQLFQNYPNNFDSATGTFTDLAKNKVTIPLPDLEKKYARIGENNDGIVLFDDQDKILYSITFDNLNRQLSPVIDGINREKLDWAKRIFYVDNGVFKTADLDGGNPLVHRLVCGGQAVIPSVVSSRLFARTPDGKLLAFISPAPEGDHGQIMLYDLVKDSCQQTGLNQTTKYQENFSFSPDGSYLAHADGGINVYVLNTRSDYQLSAHISRSYTNSTEVSGPLVWSGDSKFIYAAVVQTADRSTALVQDYFNENYLGTENNVLSIPAGSVYAVSPDGMKILYTKDQAVYQYDVDKGSNSFYKAFDSTNPVSKIVWLRNGTVITNQWGAADYVIDFDGENYAFSQNGAIKIRNLTTGTDKTPVSAINGQPLSFFY